MTVCLYGVSALEFWRTSGLAPERLPRLPAQALASCVASGPDLAALRNVHAQLRIPVHLLVSRASLRLVSLLVTTHLCTTFLPDGCLLRATPGVIVASPELCFLQMAQSGNLTRHELMLLSYEMCGRYAPPANGDSKLVKRARPLMTIERTRQFLAALPRVRGIGNAERALTHVRERARSPQESVSRMMLCLPRRLGGLALPGAELDVRVDYDAPARRIARREYALCDLYWPNAKLDVEYEGAEYHDGEKNMRADKARANALAHMGVSVISLFDEHIRSDQTMLDAARDIADKLGVRMKAFSEKDVVRRAELRRAILEHPGSARAVCPGLRSERPLLASVLKDG